MDIAHLSIEFGQIIGFGVDDVADFKITGTKDSND